MRPLEVAFLLANVPLMLSWLRRQDLPRWAHFLPALVLVLLVLHLILEKPRWHMGPGYLATLVALLVFYWPKWLYFWPWSALAGIGLLALAITLGTLLPVFSLPRPTGDFPIGTVTLHLVDSSRQETQGDSPSGHRELMIQVWYPAAHSGPSEPYRTFEEVGLKKAHLTQVMTHASLGVPMAQSKSRYPLVIFSPNWTGPRNQNLAQVEELASHGFIVVGIDHPYGTEITVFPDGRKANSILGTWMDTSSDESVRDSIHFADKQLEIRTADVRFVLDSLERLNQHDPQGLFTSRLDLSCIGIFGHSFGGAVAVNVCRVDARVKAGINLDGSVFGETRKAIGKPFMVMTDADEMPTSQQLTVFPDSERRLWQFILQNTKDMRAAMMEKGGPWITIRGVSHMNFCDSPLYSPVRRVTGAGAIRPERAVEIINTYVLAFFQKHLNGTEEPLLNSTSTPYPEVVVEQMV